MFRTLVRALRQAFSSTRRGTPRRLRARLALEPLDERIVPAVFNWTGAGGDLLWSNADNWVSNGLPGVPGATDRAQFLMAAPSIVDDAFGGTVAELFMLPQAGQHLLDVSFPLLVTDSIDITNARILVGPASQLTGRQVTATDVTVDGGGTFFVMGTATNPGQMTLSDSNIIGAQTTLWIDTHATLDGLQFNFFTGSRLVNRGTTRLAHQNIFNQAEVENQGSFQVQGLGSFTGTTINNLAGHFDIQTMNNLTDVTVDNSAQMEFNAASSLMGVTLNNSGQLEFNAAQTFAAGSIQNT